MPAYFVLHNRVLDDVAMQSYIPKAVESMAAYGAELLVLDEKSDVKEGSCEFPRTVVIKFDSRERAEAWYACAGTRRCCPFG